MGCNEKTFEELPYLTKNTMKEWAAMGCNRRTMEELNNPSTKIASFEWAAMGYNGRTFEELPSLTKIAM